MHYFSRNIGDYHKKAGRLNMLQHGAYTLLMDACYDRERFPTFDEAIEWCWASTPEEVAAVEFVLKKFFKVEDGLYVQGTIREEVQKYQENCLINKEIAIKREQAKRDKKARTVIEACTNEHEPAPNHKPITNNQEPLTKKEKDITAQAPKRPKAAKNFDVSNLDFSSWPQQPNPQILADWVTMRKNKRAAITQTVINDFGRELQAALVNGYSVDQCLSKAANRNWQGFEAAWMNGNGYGRNSVSDREARLKDQQGFINGTTSLFGKTQDADDAIEGEYTNG